ncbi:MAG: EAL domain-containing protein [Ectothiorhodospiraceae bacterium]|nr:EAL domain-containing protein [Ectothiorhodospiraceae bacterium]
MRALQIRSVVRLTPLTAVVNTLNVAIVGYLFRQSDAIGVIVAWGLAVLGVNAAALVVWYRTRGAKAPRRVSTRGTRRATWHASILALLWAIPPATLFPGAELDQQLFLVAITTGMMCAGGFALSTVRNAGSAFAIILGMGAAVALLRSDLGVALPMCALLVIYAATVVLSVVFTSSTFRARVVAELEAEQQHQVIGLLLRDFEQHAADVLWEVDANLRLRRVSERLSAFVDAASRAVEGQALTDLIGQRQSGLPCDLRDDARSTLRRLTTALASDRPFRDLEVPVRIGERTAWWSFTAKPLPGGGWRGVISDVTAAEVARRHVWQLAHHDSVTGLANRRRFRQALQAAVDDAVAGRSRSALLCIDLDGFKAVNDSFGHSLGDRLLSVVAQRLQGQSRHGDLVARLGGDEFGIVLRDVDRADLALQAARRILDALARPCEVDGVTIPIGACVGVALCPSDGDEPDNLLKNADVALYAAKAEGRGQVRCFSFEMGSRVSERLRIEHALADALPRQQLHLAYQPKLHLATRRVTGFEALLRWSHPELGEVPPSVFIPVAEECAMIHALGAWVLENACREARGWPGEMSVAVNVSGLQLAGRDLVGQVARVLDEVGLDPRRLELEVTESVLLGDTEATFATLHQLRQLGVRVALDDFGTGYSAMSYLRRFPFDTLKIDRSFLAEITDRADARAIVGAIVELAHALRMETVAEGVEAEAALHLLAEHHCDLAQGYAIARPMPAAAVRSFLVG